MLGILAIRSDLVSVVWDMEQRGYVRWWILLKIKAISEYV